MFFGSQEAYDEYQDELNWIPECAEQRALREEAIRECRREDEIARYEMEYMALHFIGPIAPRIVPVEIVTTGAIDDDDIPF